MPEPTPPFPPLCGAPSPHHPAAAAPACPLVENSPDGLLVVNRQGTVLYGGSGIRREWAPIASRKIARLYDRLGADHDGPGLRARNRLSRASLLSWGGPSRLTAPAESTVVAVGVVGSALPSSR